MNGMFLTFEGIEGCGKSTQLAQLADHLRAQGHTVCTTREPGGTIIGDHIRQLLLDPDHHMMTPMAELLLYAASRAQHVEEVIRPAIARGEIVLCDRYADASMAYQGYGRQLPKEQLQQLHNLATQSLQPERTFLIDVSVEVSAQRVTSRNAGKDRLEQEALEFHQRVRDGYLELAANEPQRFVVIDGSQSIEEITAELIAAL